jgi:hypothetical protein
LLQNLSFELIAKSLNLWRTYADDKRGKGEKIAKAALIHKMLMDAMKLHPDIVEIKEIREAYEELRAQNQTQRPLSNVFVALDDVSIAMRIVPPEFHESFFNELRRHREIMEACKSTAGIEEFVRKGGEEEVQRRMMELARQHLSEKDQTTLKRALARDPQLQGEVSEWSVVKKIKSLLENDRPT